MKVVYRIAEIEKEEARTMAEKVLLTESDVPGASLNDRRPEDLTVVELKRWLACRGAHRSGTKPELVKRYFL